MEDPDLRAVIEILKLQMQMSYDTRVSSEAMKRLMNENPQVAKMLSRFEDQVKAEVSQAYVLAQDLILGIEAKLKGSIQ